MMTGTAGAELQGLVIACDTSTARLAGALGRPVWILNRFDSCWRWCWPAARAGALGGRLAARR